jgi:uncharacterized membrane protein YkoI
LLVAGHALAQVNAHDVQKFGDVVAPETQTARAQQSKVSLDEAVSIARSRYGGKVISAQTQRRKGRAVHHVKLLSDSGQVRTVKIDGESGRIL